jgi:predicted lipoprotein with Yx(FWY)xxD motif
METQRRFALVGTVAATAMLLTGCGALQGSDSASSDKGSSGYGQQAPGAAAPAAEPKINWTLETADNAQLGKIMTDGKGWTLYLFTKDRPNTNRSACVQAACAKLWPPATINTTNLATKGFDATKLGRFKRPDGHWQLTLNGWPLYRFAKDKNPGDINGQKVKGTWYVVSWRGTKALGKAGAGAAGGGAAGGGGATGGSKARSGGSQARTGGSKSGGGSSSGGGGSSSGGGGYGY